MNLVFVGHVDHGKSTVIGRLLFDTGSVVEGKHEQIRAACAAEGTEFEYAFLLDALLEEQAQNITIDTTRVPFRTPHRAFTIIDAPGHKEFLKNMITGAASADAAVLIIDAQDGLREQSRRHAYLLTMLGVRHVVVAVNKMDLVGYAESAFAKLESEICGFLAPFGLQPTAVIPISAKNGDGLVQRSAAMPWFSGPTLIAALETIPGRATGESGPLRLLVQDVYRFDSKRVVVGMVESGTLKVGDTVDFHPGARRTRVRTFETADLPNEEIELALAAGRTFSVTLEDELFVERGHIGAAPGSTPAVSREFVARVFWLHHEPLRVGDSLPLRLCTQENEARVVSISRVLDATTLAPSPHAANAVQRNEIAEVRLRTRRPLVFDPFASVPATGRVVLQRENRIAGGGVIDSIVTDGGLSGAMPVASVAREALLGHRGAVIWLTGLSGSGKSTVANALEQRMLQLGVLPVVLDGDVLRAGLCSGLGFSDFDRHENIRRAAEAALLVAEAGAVVVTALISPFRADRQIAAERCIARGVPFAEVFVNAPLAECERRDPKLLYQRARAGKITEFTGISSPYEVPLTPTLELHTDVETVEQSVAKLEALVLRLVLPAGSKDFGHGADI